MPSNRRGRAKLREYGVWADMLQRCKNPRLVSYKYYGARGIKVCERWQSFENFYADMGSRPEGASLDRIDVDCDYQPSNCRWATAKQQSLNRRNNRLITMNSMTKPLTEWAREFGLKPVTVFSRIYQLGWSPERALTSPINFNGKWHSR